MDRLHTIAKLVRDAIEQIEPLKVEDEWDEDINLVLERFPQKSCEEASAFLANILKYNYNYEKVKIVHANPKTGWGYHTWVKIDDIDIDITPDQFNECSDKVIVERNSVFHTDNFNLIDDWEGLIDVVHWSGSREKCFNKLLRIINLD